MNTKSRLCTIALATSLLLSRIASADPDPPPAPAAPPPDADVCTTSYEGAQELMRPNRSESKLLLARESLRTCLRSNCKSWIVADCSKWLSEVETRIPTVVFSAKTTAGRDLTDVRVTNANGETVAQSLDGHSIEMEPGPHDFVFLGPAGGRVERHALVREGEKAQNVSAVFEAAPGEVGPTGPQPPVLAPRAEKATPTLRYVGYGLAGAGVVGLGLGAVFGLTAIAKKNDAKCDGNGFCDAGPRADALDAARVSTIAFVAGAVLGAGGVALILLSPSSSSSSTTSAHVDARIWPNGAGIGGTW
jgi:hypothetical protein